jgi:hypothetical protein
MIQQKNPIPSLHFARDQAIAVYLCQHHSTEMHTLQMQSHNPIWTTLFFHILALVMMNVIAADCTRSPPASPCGPMGSWQTPGPVCADGGVNNGWKLKVLEAEHFWRHSEERTLLTVHTSHNGWYMLRTMLVSLAACRDKFDLVVFDDHSGAEEVQRIEDLGVKVVRWGDEADGPQGLTNSWNLAWQYARQQKYHHLIICNNDLLVPDGAVSALVRELDSGQWDVVVPMVSERGSKYAHHKIGDNYPKVNDWTDKPIMFMDVQQELRNGAHGTRQALLTVEHLPFHNLNGYMMAMDIKRMTQYQNNSKKQLMFDPRTINVNNEDMLFKKMVRKGGKLGVVTDAFVFHYKGFTLSQAPGGHKNRDEMASGVVMTKQIVKSKSERVLQIGLLRQSVLRESELRGKDGGFDCAHYTGIGMYSECVKHKHLAGEKVCYFDATAKVCMFVSSRLRAVAGGTPQKNQGNIPPAPTRIKWTALKNSTNNAAFVQVGIPSANPMTAAETVSVGAFCGMLGMLLGVGIGRRGSSRQTPQITSFGLLSNK